MYFINCKKVFIYLYFDSFHPKKIQGSLQRHKQEAGDFIYPWRSFLFSNEKGQTVYVVGVGYKNFQVRLSCADTVNKSRKHTRLQILATLSIYTDILPFDAQAPGVVKPPFHPPYPKVTKREGDRSRSRTQCSLCPFMHMGPFQADPW